MRLRTETRGKDDEQVTLILVAICFSTTAFAQSAPPKSATSRRFG